jgi:spore germination protein
MRVKTALCLALVLAIAGAVSACGATKKPIPVLGFQPQAASTSYIGDNASVLSSVGVDGLLLTGPGKVSKVDQQERSQVATAKGQSLSTQMLVSNYSNKIENFTEKLAYETLKSRGLTARLAKTLAADATKGGWNGIMLDLELLQPRDAAGLVQLVTDLRADLPARDKVSTTVSNNTSEVAFESEGYDLYALARAGADIVLMAYDDHGPWEKQPGPVGPLSWQRKGIAIVRRFVPDKQLIFGVAGYGYAWEKHRTISVSDSQAVTMAHTKGAKTHWDAAAGEWTSHLKDGTTIWWSDGRSFKVRVKLAEKLHLGGLAIWSLASCGQLSF